MTALEPYAARPIWVTWRNEERNGEPTKVPYNPKTHKKAQSSNPKTWGTRAQATAAMKVLVNGQGGGIGLELGDLGDGVSIGGIDLDTCLSDGTFEPWATEVMSLFPSYREISPSGTGAKIFFRYRTEDLPGVGLGDQFGRSFKRGKGEHPPAIELYLKHRYFAVTGDRLPDAPDELVPVPLASLKRLVDEIGPAFVEKGKDKDKATSARDSSRSAMAFRKGAALRRAGATYEEMVAALRTDPETADWAREKGDAVNGREFKRIWDRSDDNNDLPPPFYEQPDGIWYPKPATKIDPEPEPVWVCAPFRVVAETTDEAGGEWGLLLSWPDRDGHEHQLSVKRRLFHASGNDVAAELDAAGLTCGTSQHAHELLKRLLSQIASKHRKRCVTRGGWHQMDGGLVYVLPNGEAIGPGADEIIMQGARCAEATRPKGTLQEWQDNVAAPAAGNHRLGFFLSAAFAPPLLHLTGDSSGGFHMHGASSTGKTTALAGACSVWGRASTDGIMKTWRTTSNGVEGIASEACDGLVPLDEMGQVDGKDGGEIVYSLANGAGKARAARDGSARLVRTWRVISLSTGEVTLATKMQERGATPMAGQDVRLVNIPADAGARLGVFDTLHNHTDGAALAQHLLNAAKQYYGTAAPAFIAQLVKARQETPDKLVAYINKQRQEFLDIALPPVSNGQVIAVARRFALIAAAGALATRWGILPWNKDEARAAAVTGFRAWLDARGGSGALEDVQAVRQVRAFLELHEESRFALLLPRDPNTQGAETERRSERPTINRAGFRREVTDGDGNKSTEFLIFSEVWRNEVCKGIDAKLAAKILFDRCWLQRDGKHFAKLHRIPELGPTRLYTVSSAILLG